jgi:pimeloyl-ACP methyl ester carboxylesterase
MEHFCDRLLEMGLTDGDVIVGSSFGGMVACSVSARVDLGGILLLGSTDDPRDINQVMLTAGYFARSFPGVDLQALVRPFAKSWITGPKAVVLDMFARSDCEVMMGMHEAIMRWGGARPACPVRRVHGRFDPVIPWRSHRHYDAVVGCTHLVALEAPLAARRWLDVLLDDLAPS